MPPRDSESVLAESFRTASMVWANQELTASRTFWMRRGGGSTGCSNYIPLQTSFIIKWPMTAITKAGGCRKTKLLTTAGARVATASYTSRTVTHRDCASLKANRTELRTWQGGMPLRWALVIKSGKTILAYRNTPYAC